MSARRIAEEILQGRKILLWVGAGNSCSAGIRPDADDETGLAYHLALIHYENDRERILAEVGPRFRLADLAAVIGRPRIRDLILQQGWMDIGLADAHRAIASLVKEGFHVEVVTVNFDPLLERGLLAEGLRTEVIHSSDSCTRLAEEAAFVIKVHGCPYRDNDPTHLLMLPADLIAPPQWVTAFLNDRLLERVFIYVGFSGNAQYVRDCVRAAAQALRGNMRDAYAVDIHPTEAVFANGNQLGDFYTLSRVPRENYSSGGADPLFREIADHVFRHLMITAFEAARHEAGRHGCHDHNWLGDILNNLTHEQARSFVGRLGVLKANARVRLQEVALQELFKWVLIFACRGVIQKAGFMPVLAAPYRPGPNSTASALVLFVDGFKMEAGMCCEEIRELAQKEDFKFSFQVAAEPRWYAVIVNCKGNVPSGDMTIIGRDPQSIVRGYDPIVFVDENTMVNRVAQVEDLFQ